jgi:UDP-N-acetyl-D-mannosaminuronic acid dehydrogenase
MLVPENFPDRSVCVLGLGYVGLTLAATMASVGFRVWGIEIRPQVVADLRKGQPHFHEPGLQDHLSRTVESGALTVHESIPTECDATVYIITVGTPLGPNSRARLDMIEHTAREVAGAMPPNALVVLRSTVRLGTTRSVVAPILEATGRACDLAFCPERTLEGSALKELRTLPQIVGGATLQATVRASQLFQFITVTTIRVANLETAETIKLVDNTQRDVHFAFSNEVARICDAIGVSAAEVINAGKLGYQRTNLPLPGPVGGPCLEKDPYIMAEGVEALGVTPELTLAARRLNEAQPAQSMAALKRIVDQIDGFPKNPVIALLGLAFKGQPETDDLRGTMARPILEAIKERFPGATLRGFDAVVAAEAIRDFGLAPAPTLAEAVASANLAVITNNHPVFAGMPVETLSATMAKPAMIYDFWNTFYGRTLRLAPGTGYMALGSHGCALLPTSVSA